MEAFDLEKSVAQDLQLYLFHKTDALLRMAALIYSIS